jgi:hypothetical protein
VTSHTQPGTGVDLRVAPFLRFFAGALFLALRLRVDERAAAM